MTATHTVPALGLALPEIVLAIGALALVLLGAIRGERSTPVVSIGALVVLVVAFLAVLMQPAERLEGLSGSFVSDAFSRFMKALTLIASMAGIVLSTDYFRREGIDRFQQMVDMEITRVERSWAGLRTFAPDRTPVVGPEPGAQGFFWLCGQGGYGIQTSPALSRLAADLILGLPPSLPDATVAALSPARFRH